MRKTLLILSLLILALGLPVLAFAQEATPEAAAMTSWTCPAGFEGQKLNLWNWTTYIAENTIPDFEKLCGVTVSQDFFASNEELIARLRQGNPGYDVIVPTGAFIPQMVRENLLEPLDLEKVPNLANVSEFLRNPTYDPGNQYSVPYQWGTIGIGYNVKKVGKEITTWKEMFEYQGNVAWLEDARNVLGVALHILGFDPNTTNADEIAQARDLLAANGKNVRSIAQDDGQEKLVTGEVDMVIEYSGDIFQIISDCETNTDANCKGEFAYLLPEEGSVVWVDNLAIAKDAPNKALALVFIDYILDAQVGADISNYTAYASPNQKAIDGKLIDEALLSSPVIYPSEETSKRLFFIVDVGDAAQLYNDAWSQLKVMLGQ